MWITEKAIWYSEDDIKEKCSNCELFNDNYFKGLDKRTIIELAKKSIRITSYNRELEQQIEEIEEIIVGYKSAWNNEKETIEKIEKILKENK